MTIKILLSAALITVSTLAQDIDFIHPEKKAKRVDAQENNVIASYHNSVKEAMASVVNISTQKTTKTSFSSSPFGQMFDDPFFKRFFGRDFKDAFPKERVQRSLGSGVILSKEGHIVTNSHVVRNADEIVVTLGGSDKEYEAKIVGTDKESDLALIQIDADNLRPATIAKNEDLRIGDVVFAIGNPFGVGQTVTQGIISATNRDKVGINRYEDFIQTDASINPGNSGGALIDSRGVLIGINSAILTRSGGNNGIGFAIPAAMVQNIVDKLAKYGTIERGYMGVSIQDIQKEARSMYDHTNGALVMDIEPGSPADEAGLKRGDLIYAVDGEPVEDASDLSRKIGSYQPGQKVQIEYEREGENKATMLELIDRESSGPNLTTALAKGLQLSSIDTSLAQKYRLPENIEGVLVADVDPGSQAEKLGFKPGDVIIQIESFEITDMDDLQTALQRYEGKKKVFINRYGQTFMQIVE